MLRVYITVANHVMFSLASGRTSGEYLIINRPAAAGNASLIIVHRTRSTDVRNDISS